MKIRDYRAADAAGLTGLYNEVYPQKEMNTAAFEQRLRWLVREGGRAWVVEWDGQVVGYAAVLPVPGLEGVMELEGLIGPPVQRQGLGSSLLRHVLAELKESEVHQVSYAVEAMDSPAALFLERLGFAVEHEEWRMRRDRSERLPTLPFSSGCRIMRYERAEAIPLFRRLYRESFGPLPWFQEYTSDEEVAAELKPGRGVANDLLFLTIQGEAVGFAWLRGPEDGVGAIEPIGLLPAYRGKGYGRQLLLAALYNLRGASEVWLGVWVTNRAAIKLYEAVGFRPVGKVTYLAYEL